MVKKEQKEHYISTDARVILSDWKTLATIINEHTTLIKESSQQAETQEESPSTKTLSDRQIDDALNGPLQYFLKDKLTAYATIARVRLELNIPKEEVFKEHRQPPKEYQIAPGHLANLTIQDMNELYQQLEDLTESHFEAWKQHLEQWKTHLIQRLKENGAELNTTEIAEYQGNEPISELQDRFTDLQIELPKLKKTDMNYSNYLRLKTDIAIYNALSRQHKPHEQADINQVLKALKKDFDQINKQEKELIQSQKTETERIIEPIVFAKF